MLKLFSRLEKGRSVIILFFAVLLVLGLVVAGVYNRSSVATANPFKSREVVASVRGDDVTVADFTVRQKARESEFSRYGGQVSLATFGITGERLLDELINSRLVVQEAERLNLSPSEEEVKEEILRQSGASTGGFDFKVYRENVARNYGSVALFEETMRDIVAGRKLRAYVTAGVQVSEEEVREGFMRENAEFDVLYVPVTAADLAKRINPADEELARYFQEHQTDYRFLEDQKKIRYLFVSTDKVGEKIQIPDEDLRKEFEERGVEQKQAGVRVQQIVLRVARPELDTEVLNRATALVGRVRNEQTLAGTEEDFAELARGNSEDAATAQKGGWLPNPVRRNPNPKPPAAGTPGSVNDLLQNTLDMKEGQISDPMKTGNAYYIFRRGPSVLKTFEEARNELLVSLRNRRAYGVAQGIASRAAAHLKETKDIQAVAREFAAEANMAPAEMVKETGLVKPGDVVPGIGSNPQFEEAIKPLNEPGQIGDHLNIPNGFAVPVLVEKREPRIPELAEVRDRVLEDFRQARAKEQVEQTARELAGAAGPEALKAAAERLGLKAETEEAFKWGRPLGTAGADPALDAAVYALKAGETAKTPVKVGDSWYVVGVTRRKDADLAEFGKRQAELTERALDERRMQVFDEYITAIRRRVEQEGGIEIERDVLARLDAEAAPPAALPRAPIDIPTGQ
ncbi:MAG TPA: peptidyl-prolyl cis-trans isomerase [Pyrinomonadaceae bacterium]|nr:peptidyl-prolyl cis-trans isomerase [Pyrinomonadaceae bacterium]